MAETSERPLSLHPLVGHEPVRSALVRAHLQDMLPGALLLHGPRGIGKQRLALWLAQLTVCAEPSEDGPCNRCGPCRMALALEHPDIHWYFPLARPKGVSRERLKDALEQARHQELAALRTNPLRPSWSGELLGLYLGSIQSLRAQAAKRPNMAKGPVFIVGQAELLVPQESSPEAANALLKLLEEPPGAARFILTSSEPGLLLPTIRSRAVPLHVPPLSQAESRSFLEEQLELDPRRAAWAARLGQGSIGRALAFLPDGEDQGPLEEQRRKAFDIMIAATSPDPSAGYAVALGFPPAKARTLIELFSFVEEWLRDLAAAAAGAEELVFNHDALPRLKKHVDGRDIEAWRVPNAFPCVERARELARGNVNPQLVVSGLIRDLRAALLPQAETGVAVT